MSLAIWYFSYGSNMNRTIFLGRRAMRPLATRCARLLDYRLTFDLPVGSGERGVANVVPAPGAYTCGVLYSLTPEEFDRLDRTEGVHVGAYRRVPVEVVLEDGERVAAFTYQSSFAREGRKPSKRYRDLLIAGAREHGLPDEYVRFLERLDLAWDERLNEGGKRGT